MIYPLEPKQASVSENAEQYCLKKQLSGDAKHSNVTINTRLRHSSTGTGSAP